MEKNGMEKTIIKTAIITLASTIVAIVLFLSCFALFAPKKLANGFDRLGNYSISVALYKRQYNKTGDYQDLSDLCTRIDEEKDFADGYKYLKLFIEDQGFDDYCSKGSLTENTTLKEFFYGKYVTSAFYLMGKEEAQSISDSYIEKYGDTTYSPNKILELLEK